MRDIIAELNAVHRQVGAGELAGEATRTVALKRTYDAPVEDVWDAITNPERIPRWFSRVSGDFQVGGKYQVEGNAGGEIVRCEPPRALRVTWVMGEGRPSEVEVRLSPGSDGDTVLELEHTAVVEPAGEEFWSRYGPGAVGVGWDLALLGLALYVPNDESIEESKREAWGTSEEGKAFMTSSAAAWAAAHEASGATPEEANSAAKNTQEFYVPQA
jgi:uncharacterized protein YndB with AHSA1/START domain